MKIKRYAELATTQATPEPVTKGKTLTVTGTLTRADWNTNTYTGFAAQKVALQFKKATFHSWSHAPMMRRHGRGGAAYPSLGRPSQRLSPT
ncbi:hypothetical protein ACFZA1_42090 [Streptomyces filipinensis]|uniref:hypothetical protein n=1 Tax=Streptomyces filipinensis TaxID=66887 RepID=UPI0036E3D7DF